MVTQRCRDPDEAAQETRRPGLDLPGRNKQQEPPPPGLNHPGTSGG